MFSLPAKASNPPRPAPPQTSEKKSVTDSSYPVAKTGNQVDDYHGIKIADPYRWMEDVDSSDTHAWIEAENKLTFGKLAQIPGRDHIREKLSAVWNYEKFSPPEKFGDHYFYTRNDGLQNQSVLYVTESLDAEPRVLLDPNKLSADGTVALKSYSISSDGKFLAYGLSSGGSDWEEWHVLDVDKAKNTDDVLKWVKFSGASWRRDGTGFFYSRYDEPKGENALKAANKFQKLYFHRLGTKQSDDQLIYERKDQPDWMFGGVVSDDGRYLIISVSRSTEPKNLVLYRDLAKKNADAVVETLIGEWDASYQFINNSKDKLYFLTDNDAPRYRVISVDIKKPDKDHWNEVVGASAGHAAELQHDRSSARSRVHERRTHGREPVRSQRPSSRRHRPARHRHSDRLHRPHVLTRKRSTRSRVSRRRQVCSVSI